MSTLADFESRAFRSLERRPIAGTATRVLRTALLDAPVAWWFGVVEHEVFGHGGRARELGSSAGFHLGSPWAGRTSYSTFDAGGLSDEDLLRVYAGGSEANGSTATGIERELAAGRSARPLEWLFLASNRLVASDYVLRTTPDPMKDPAGFHAEWSGGGDVARYLGYLHARYHGQTTVTPTGSSPALIAQYRRLRRQAYWNAADPGTWLSLWSVGRQIGTGRESAPLPLPTLAGRRFLPILSSDWLPDGGVASLEAVFSSTERNSPDDRARWRSIVLRRGRGPGGAFGALGAASERILRREWVRVGAEIELWSRPGRRAGGGLRLRFTNPKGRLAGSFVEVGAKSAGHWPGRPAGTGLMIRIGGTLGAYPSPGRDPARAPADPEPGVGSAARSTPGRTTSSCSGGRRG